MPCVNSIRTLPSRCREFLGARDGSIVMTFALALLPIVGFVGAAVDYSRANAARAAMQSALDSMVLMLSKDAATLSQAQLQVKAQSYFLALLNRPELQNVTVNAPVYTSVGGSQLAITATAKVNADFMKVMGVTQMNVSSTATVKWGNSRLRVALALDNTGSMSQNGKMTALKTATHNLLNTLQSAATQPGDVYVSIIPFAKDVNVGAGSLAATWLRWTAWDASNGSWSPCTQWNHSGQCIGGTWMAANHSTWTGCVTDRDNSPVAHNTLNTTPIVGNSPTLFPAEQYANCPVALLPQTYDWSALHAKVDAMTPTGNTNTTIGLAWAWQSLSENAPLNAPPVINDGIETKKVIIFLTDGTNTQDRWSSNASTIDARMQAACANAKAADVTIYTVLVMQGNASLLQNCASSAEKFFNLTAADQVVATFDQIGTQLSKLRIAN
ncbi:MAG: TadE/TadG family protein [Proteobacteria bacterium]|nr:TadE/TadG family protein [Pseudomonadota bacterium]